MRNLKGCQKAYSITPFFFFFFLFTWGHEELAHQPEEGMGWEFEFKFWTLFLQIVFWEFFCIFPKSVWLLLNTCALEAPLEASPLKALPSLWLPCVEPFFFPSWGEFLLEPEFTYFLLDIPICLPTFSWARQRLPRFFFIKSHYSCKTHLVWKDPDCSICAFVMSSLYLV